MKERGIWRCAAVVACVLAMAPAVQATALDGTDELVRPAAVDRTLAPSLDREWTSGDYRMDTEMVVHNWVLCANQAVAEQLVRAREESDEKALLAYAEFARARSCGKFPVMHVILRQPLYISTAQQGLDARVFGALVNLSGNWANAFVVSGSLPEE